MCLLPALCVLGLAIDAHADASGEPTLAFALHSAPIRSVDLRELSRIAPPVDVRVFEPYEEREVEFSALPLAPVLDAIYGDGWRTEEELLFACRDGYQPSVPVQRVLEHDAWLAFDRAGEAGFSIVKLESGSRKEIDLSPFYLIWDNLGDAQLRLEGDYGWPYQVVGVDVIRTRDRFPHTAPPEGATPQVLAGYAAFRIHCSRCHAINGEGGSLGPELNSPRNPVEYRELDWLRSWLDDPAQILPTARMPRLNPTLSERAETIDYILAYLGAMANHKRHLEPGTPGAPEAGPFESFYAGPLQHPGLLWIAAGLAIALCLFRRGLHPSMRRYCVLLGLLSLLDAWLTANHVYGLGALPPALAGGVPLFFVLAGDFRYLLVITAGTPDGRLEPTRRSLLSAAALTVLVPVLTQIVLTVLPEPMRGARVMFLIYELSFVGLTLALLRWHPSARSGWIRSVSWLVVLYYGLWAAADAIILRTGSDLGHLLRVLPNVLYYGGLIAALGLSAPRVR